MSSPAWKLALPVTGAALAIALLGFKLGAARRAERDVPAPAAPSPDDLSALRREVEALKRQVARQSGTLAWSMATAPSPPPPPRDPQQIERTQRALESLLDGEYRTEPIDHDWAPRAAAEMKQAIAAGIPGAEVTAAECARTICRLQLRFTEEDVASEIGDRLPELAPFATEVYYLHDPSSPLSTTLYVARPGHPLPRMATAAPTR
jgi:hypothetical protein